MGVVTKLELDEINSAFSKNFKTLRATKDGICDTTYIVDDRYILKKYETTSKEKIKELNAFLDFLKNNSLNISTCQDEKSNLYLYDKLEGNSPRVIKAFHIVELARFMAKFHNSTKSKSIKKDFVLSYALSNKLDYIKQNFYPYFKRLKFVDEVIFKNDGLIHGDIFKDNTVFDGNKIGVFDFIDFADGSFCFDLAVAFVGFDGMRHTPFYENLFLKTYNQNAPKKISKQDFKKMLSVACGFYAILRIEHYRSVKRAKELL